MKLYKHQQELLKINPKKCGIFFDTGTGKTLTAIKLSERNSLSSLVICPKSLKEQWENEIEKFKECDLEWCVMTKETFKRDWDKIKRYQTIIIDEAHLAFANFKSQTYKAMASYLSKYKIDNIYLLTATPYTSNCWSIYSLARLLGHSWNWYQWKKRYFYDVNMGGRMIPVQRNNIEPEMAQMANKIGYVKRMEELFDVPEQIFMTETFDLNKKQNEMIDAINDVLPIVRWTKVHQIEQGCLKGDGYIPNQVLDCEKTKRIIELIKTTPKIAIIARYNVQIEHYVSEITKAYPTRKISVIRGETNNKAEIVDKINESTDNIVIINAACNTGFNLWSIPIMVFASTDFSFVNYKQMIGRILRANHLKKNIYINLITSGNSVDRAVMKCMDAKKDFHEEIMNYERNTTTN